MWWDIDTIIVKEKLSDTPILLAHAFCGCDTTSAIYIKGKIKMLLYQKSEKFRESVDVLGKIESTPDDIRQAAIKDRIEII